MAAPQAHTISLRHPSNRRTRRTPTTKPLPKRSRHTAHRGPKPRKTEPHLFHRSRADETGWWAEWHQPNHTCDHFALESEICRFLNKLVKTASPPPKTAGHEQWSPRTRGWSPASIATDVPVGVVPAHAGVVPPGSSHRSPCPGGPRARGGGPRAIGREIGRNEWSPRTRGWSRGAQAEIARRTVVPAHAGVVPPCGANGHRPWSGPRARGGGPKTDPGQIHRESVVPAHAGVVPHPCEEDRDTNRGPRARGGGPPAIVHPTGWTAWSPRTRGWSRHRPHAPPPQRVVPAHAGVVRTDRGRSRGRSRGPRARGGGPPGSSSSSW